MVLAQTPSPTRRGVLKSIALFGAAAAVPAFALSRPAAAAAAPTVWGMSAAPSILLSRAVASDAVQALAPGAAFSVWKTADQMRAGVVSGEMALFAAPTYAVANLRARGARAKLVNVLTWGLLSVVARDAGITTPDRLAGKTILLAAKNDAPDLLLRLVLGWAGLDPERDVTLDYVGTSAEVVPLFLGGRADVALLPEPAATAALLKAKKEGLSAVRAIDVTEVYRARSGRAAGIPQAGLAVTEDFAAANAGLVAALHAGCVEAAAWAAADPAAAGALGASFLDLPAPLIQASLPHVRLDVRSAAEARADIELYATNLMDLSPAIVGGKLPDDGYYWG